jgi:hypothetical protein
MRRSKKARSAHRNRPGSLGGGAARTIVYQAFSPHRRTLQKTLGENQYDRLPALAADLARRPTSP